MIDALQAKLLKVLETDEAGPAEPVGCNKLLYRSFKAELIETHERPYLQSLMEEAGWNVERTAELCGLSDTHVRTKLKKYGIKVPRSGSMRPPRR